MNREKELIKNTGILFLGKACVQFLSYLLLPLYTSILPTSDYGIIDLAVTYVTLLAPLITIQIETAIFRFLVENRDNNSKKIEIITTSLLFVLGMTLTLSILLIVGSFIVDIKYKYYLIMMIFSMICSNVMLQIARGNGNNLNYSIASILSAISTIGFNILFLVVLKTGLTGMFISTIISNMTCSFFLFVVEKVYKYIKIKSFNKKLLKELTKYSYPFVLNGIIWWIIGVSDRTIISVVIGVSANGVYSIANKFSNIFIQAFNIYILSFTESVLLHIDDEDGSTFISKACNESLKLFYSICIMIIAVMPFIFNIIINVNYKGAYDYIPLLLIGSLFNVIVGLVSPIYAARKLTKEIAKTSFVSGILNLLVDLLLIKYIGVYAAILSTIIAFFTMAIYRYIDIQKYTKVEFSKSMVLLFIISYIIIIFLYYQKKLICSIILLIFSTIISIMLNKNIIKGFLKIVKSKIIKVKSNKKRMES